MPLLRAIVACCLLLAAAPAAAQQHIVFPSPSGPSGDAVELQGLLYRPAGPGPFAAVVGMHGCSGMWLRSGAPMPSQAAWAETLRAAGYLVLLVDGFTARHETAVCRDYPASVSPSKVRTRDALAALDHLRARPDVRGDRVALLGWSHGGGAVLYAIDGAPPGGFRAAVALYPGWCRRPAQRAQWMPALPLLVLMGADDDWTPAGPCVELIDDARSRGATIDRVVYPDAHHAFNSTVAPRALAGAVGPGGRTPTVGGNPAARADAHRRVVEFLRLALGG